MTFLTVGIGIILFHGICQTDFASSAHFSGPACFEHDLGGSHNFNLSHHELLACLGRLNIDTPFSRNLVCLLLV